MTPPAHSGRRGAAFLAAAAWLALLAPARSASAGPAVPDADLLRIEWLNEADRDSGDAQVLRLSWPAPLPAGATGLQLEAVAGQGATTSTLFHTPFTYDDFGVGDAQEVRYRVVGYDDAGQSAAYHHDHNNLPSRLNANIASKELIFPYHFPLVSYAAFLHHIIHKPNDYKREKDTSMKF